MYQESMFFWMTLSCVIAVYNEEKFLPYSLPTITDPLFNEVVMVLDRCTDSSGAMVDKVKDERFVLVSKEVQDWANPCAEAKNLACSTAMGDLLMISDADIVLDIDSVRRATELFEEDEIDAVVFTYKQYSLFGPFLSKIKDVWVNLLWKVISKSGFMPTRSGIYMIRKDVAIIPDADAEYDYVQQTLRTRPLHTKTVHLRPKRSRETQMLRGRARGRLAQYSTLKMIIMSILQLEPYRFVGFLEGRRQK
jgi:glycosyltransferase involved in cell wall biosynthesis